MVVAASGAPGVGRAFSLDRHVVVQKNVCVAGHTRALSLYGRLPLPRRALSTTAADSKTKSGDPLFAPIEEHAILGDTRSAALVTREGCIDWMCLPRFDADPVFARLLDAEHGGRFELSIEGAVSGRRYRRDSAVLETSWHGESGTGLITEAMALDVKGMRPQLVLVRTVECTSGTIEVRALFEPRGGIPGRPPAADDRGGYLICWWNALALIVQTFPHHALGINRELRITLSSGNRFTVLMSMADRTPAVIVTETDALRMIEEADATWRAWADGITYKGPYRGHVVRSLITMKLLTYSPSGAPVAAPTTSMPEVVGGGLNWDYRYSWPRDAGIGSGALMSSGKREEAEGFMRWLNIASALTRPRMSVLYTLDGTPGHRERELRDVSGYRGSLPVRISNEAFRQHQLDVYGWVVDTAWHLDQPVARLDSRSWALVGSLVDFVAGHWHEPDAGIWERRDERRHHVSSKLLAFVALDRALRMSKQRRVRPERLRKWEDARAALRADVMTNGWSETICSYVSWYGSDEVDASLLLLPMSELEPQGSERVRQTIDAVMDRLLLPGARVLRYAEGLDGAAQEGAFLPCSFWLVDALARCGRLPEAKRFMDQALGLAGELGLMGEEVQRQASEMLGNYPLALTHSALVLAALSLEHAERALIKDA